MDLDKWKQSLQEELESIGGHQHTADELERAAQSILDLKWLEDYVQQRVLAVLEDVYEQIPTPDSAPSPEPVSISGMWRSYADDRKIVRVVFDESSKEYAYVWDGSGVVFIGDFLAVPTYDETSGVLSRWDRVKVVGFGTNYDGKLKTIKKRWSKRHA